MFPKPRPMALEKRDKRREWDRIQAAVAAGVNARDGFACRCCGRQKGSGVAIHKHHLTFRSRGGADTMSNELLLCGFCHGMIHARQLHIFGKDANKRLTFEIHEAAVVDLFGTRTLPAHVRIVTDGRR